jgi:hypothetical protein
MLKQNSGCCGLSGDFGVSNALLRMTKVTSRQCFWIPAVQNITSERCTYQFYIKTYRVPVLHFVNILNKMENSLTVDIFINSSSIFQTNLDIPMNVRPLSLNIQKICMAIIVFGTLINFLIIVVICNSVIHVNCFIPVICIGSQFHS